MARWRYVNGMAKDYQLGHGQGIANAITIERPDLRAQRAYRARRTEKIERLEAGHRAILAKLIGNDKSLATELRAISTEALGEAS